MKKILIIMVLVGFLLVSCTEKAFIRDDRSNFIVVNIGEEGNWLRYTLLKEGGGGSTLNSKLLVYIETDQQWAIGDVLEFTKVEEE